MTTHTILLVDDEPDIRNVYSTALSREFPEATILTAGNGADGLAQLAEHPVDVVISDYKMPIMDGITFLRKAREMCPTVDRIMITAFPDDTVAIAAINEAHIERFITKPFSLATLTSAVKEVIDRRIQRAERDISFARALTALKKQLDEARRSHVEVRPVDRPTPQRGPPR